MAEKGKQISARTVWRLRLGYFFKFMGRAVHYGVVPLIIYLGMTLGQTDPNLPPLTFRSFILP